MNLNEKWEPLIVFSYLLFVSQDPHNEYQSSLFPASCRNYTHDPTGTDLWCLSIKQQKHISLFICLDLGDLLRGLNADKNQKQLILEKATTAE